MENQVKRVGIYHSQDLDGYCSGAIMRLKYPDITLIGWNYGDPIPFSEIEGAEVIMADVSFPVEQLVEATKKSKSFLWIDHHISAIGDFKEYAASQANYDMPNFKAALNHSYAACELTWDVLFPEDTPVAVELLGMYDSWRQSEMPIWNNRILPFQYGMRAICTSPETFPMELLSQDTGDSVALRVSSITDSGRGILSYTRLQNAKACKNAFEAKFEGLRAICLNTQDRNSTTFDSIWDESKYDIMIPFSYDGEMVSASLYTTKDNVDCSALAKKYGGGGHKKAAGFKYKNITILKRS